MEFTERAHPSFERDDDNGELENGEPLLADQSASNGGDPESKSMPNERKDSTISIVAAVAVASSTSIVAATTTASAGKTPIVTRMYAKRHVVLWVFILLSASNAMQWIQYSIISHIISEFYEVSYYQVDWTSMIYMLTYMLLVFPGSWFLDRYGLRKSVLLGAIGNCLGAWIKLFSTSRDRFWLTFIGQTVVGASQIFILGIPPRLAAVWFGPKQVSTACAAGVFGNQLGIAIGFVLPPFMVHMGAMEKISSDLGNLFLISAILNTLVLMLIVFFFAERPPLPPSLAQVTALRSQDTNFIASLKSLMLNSNYMFLMVTYGINVGVFYAISTHLSQMILHYHKDAQESAGTIGLVIVLSGMAGSVATGHILDRFHHFKATTLIVYLFSFVGMVLFTFILPISQIWNIFVIAALLGFFMTGYLPLGFEFAAEITFPIAEGTTSGLLNASAQIFGVAMTIGMGNVINTFSIFWCNAFMSLSLLVGFLMTGLIKPVLKRQNAHNAQNGNSDLAEQMVDSEPPIRSV